MINKDENVQKDEALKKFLSKESPKAQSTPKSEYKIPSAAQRPVTDMDFLSVDIEMLPAGKFYKDGTIVKVRAATVAEIQSYSSIDDRNYLDVTEKMNHILASCVKIIHPNGMAGSYKDIKDNDRLYLIFMVRELTFQKNTNLAKDVTCDNCLNDFKIQFRATQSDESPRTFINYEMPYELEPFFNDVEKCFEFDLQEFDIDGPVWRLAPPSIGMQEIFFKDIKDKVQADRNPNVAFLKIIPFVLWDRSSITEEGIKEWEKKFKLMGKEEFLFLDSAVNKMTFGIKELTANCPSCGTEVHTDMSFPEGASSIFAISDPFAKFKKK